ncbi:MAG: hypothetical protein ACFFAS_04100 [Promethearchaeota archaeon]
MKKSQKRKNGLTLNKKEIPILSDDVIKFQEKASQIMDKILAKKIA